MTEHIHVLIAADQEDAYDYVGDPQYTVIKYASDARHLEGFRCHEASFTPRATNMPHWMDGLQHLKNSIFKVTGGWEGRIHYISLYEDKEPS